MRKVIQISVVAILLLNLQTIKAEDHVDLVKKGNEAFRANDFKKALDYYRQAETRIPTSPELDYNLAGALHNQEKYEEAVDKYLRAQNTTDPLLEAEANYNLGNTYFRMQDYPNAIKSYQEALILNPDDMDAKFNLELARRMLKENTQPQQQQQQQNQQQQEQQQEQQQQNQQQQEQQQEQQEQENQQEQQHQQQQQLRDQKISKEDAERILNALRDDERDLQKNVKRQVAAGNYRGKDW